MRHAFPEAEQDRGVVHISAARRTLIIGIGNPDRGDDAAGPAVARLLTSAPLRADVRLHNSDGAAMMALWEGYDVVYLVDAVRSGAHVGTIHRFEVPGAPLPSGRFSSITHAFNVLEAVELARVLDRLPERLVVYGIEAGGFELGSGIHPEVGATIRQVADAVRSEVGP